MKVVTREYKVYKYSELGEAAKEKVKEWYLDDDTRPQMLTESFKESLSVHFPDSNLNVQWSLSSCQGDGVNIYGTVNIDNLFTFLTDENSGYKDRLTDDEICRLREIDSICGIEIDLPVNSHYCYSMANYLEFAEDTYENVKDYCDADYDINGAEVLLKKFESVVKNVFKQMSSDFERDGYRYLYEIDDEEVQESCEANEWMFLEDGSFFSM